MGRAKYKEWLTKDNLTLLQGWRRDGLELQQIAHNMGIDPATLSVWQNKYEEIRKALSKGREIAYYEVENALYKSAMGYDVTEAEKVENYDADGTLISKSIRRRTRHIPPNTGAIVFVLKNIRPSAWQEKPDRFAGEEVADDGFLDALNGTAAADWENDENTDDDDAESSDSIDEE